jgi:hypothetical protein
MSVSAKQKILSVCIFLLIGTWLGACSTFSFKPAKEIVQSRVHGLMDARVNSEWGKAYEFYCPAFKEEISKDNFMSGSSMSDVLRYEIESIEINPSEGEAKVRVKSDRTAMTFEFPGVVTTQTWVKVGWDWYLYVDPKPTRSLP